MSVWERPGKSDEWYTPKYIFDAMKAEFDMDVASAPVGKGHVPAKMFIAAGDAEVPWRGFVWMNPPFGGRNGVAPWLARFKNHGNDVALVPDRTSAAWFREFVPVMDCVLFLSPRVKFEKPDGTLGKSPSTGTALFGLGDAAISALYKARHLGWLVDQWKTR